jgi:hypothetical protein
MKTMNDDDNKKPKPKKYHSKDELTSPNNYNLSATIAKLEAYSKSKHLQSKENQTEEE